jgi:hypothetical protein
MGSRQIVDCRLTQFSLSQAILQYSAQKKEVALLLAFHAELHESRSKSDAAAPGRRGSELEVLHKSSVVLLTACWEAFVENILTEALEMIARDLKDPSQLHNDLLRSVAIAKGTKLSVSSKNELYPWFFVGEGWRELLLEYALSKISELNTPDSSGVRNLTLSLLGIEDITLYWGRPGKGAKDAADRLDEYLSDRHIIAHGAFSKTKFSKSYVTNYLGFLDITVKKTEVAVKDQLQKLGLTLP